MIDYLLEYMQCPVDLTKDLQLHHGRKRIRPFYKEMLDLLSSLDCDVIDRVR